ncbi:MAG: mlaD [Alphaproteobacteria bacterium]|jgi:phospholipid/cholesterol/gamma-HCH transport system substrate-binding protein|nr:mlaD [Alphaproteobacteria bacterium]
MNRSVVETLIGAVVLIVAALFLAYAFRNVDASTPGGYEVLARFDRVDGLKKGADVTIGGIKVGTVTDQKLDPKTFQAIVRMNIAGEIKLPADTSAKLVSESLLGGLSLTLEPGGSDKNIAPGGEISRTQGAVNLMDLIGQAIFSPKAPAGETPPAPKQ